MRDLCDDVEAASSRDAGGRIVGVRPNEEGFVGPSVEAIDSTSVRGLGFFFFLLTVSPLLIASCSFSSSVLADFLGAGNLFPRETCVSLITD